MTLQVFSTLAEATSVWSEGVARIHMMRPPLDYAGINLPRWRQLIEDADRYLERWEVDAIALGWTSIDLFGCSRFKPFARIDLAGLIPLLDGRRVVELTEAAAMIAERGERHTRFTRRSASGEQVALWDLPC